jgi:hypothetical protein
MNGIMFIKAVGHGIIFFNFRLMVYNLKKPEFSKLIYV